MQVLQLQESLITKLLQIPSNLDYFLNSECLVCILGEILILVASSIRGFGVCGLGFGAFELAAIGDGYIFCRLIAAFGGEVLDFANDGFAGEDFAEDDVLAV